MRKLLLLALPLLLILSFTTPAHALLNTDNVDETKFQYRVAYTFGTGNIVASETRAEMYTYPGYTNALMKAHVVTRPANIVGMSVAGNAVLTAGEATFDVTVNGTITGIQVSLDPYTARSAAGTAGSTGSQYGYIEQDRDETAVPRGFRSVGDIRSWSYGGDYDHRYGYATALAAGDRLGVVATTNSTLAPLTNDYTINVYVLE